MFCYALLRYASYATPCCVMLYDAACMCIILFISIYACICICMGVCIWVYPYALANFILHGHLKPCVYVCVHTHTQVHAHKCVHEFPCTYRNVGIHNHITVHKHKHNMYTSIRALIEHVATYSSKVIQYGFMHLYMRVQIYYVYK